MINPTSNYVVAIQDKPAEKTQSGLYLPTNQVTNSAEVVAVGKGVSEAKMGDKIVYKSYDYTSKIDDVDYLFIKEENVLATLN